MNIDKGLNVKLLGNTVFSSDRIGVPITTFQPETGNNITNFEGTAKQLMKGRAEAVKRDLVKMGADGSRISTGEGNAESAMTTTIEIIKTE